MAHTDKPDIYARITGEILAHLEAGVKPWTQPWRAGHAAGPISRPLRSTGESYAGINTVVLWAVASTRGYSAPIWMTFKQALALGGAVRKGEKGAPVVYASAITREGEPDANGASVEETIPFLKAYTVFNVEQIDGLPAQYHARAEGQGSNPHARIPAAEAFFASLHGDVVHGGAMAAYSLDLDRIRMPDFADFVSADRYYATLAHEYVHWTRHPTRLDRDMGRKRYGDAGYAREELVAELGAAFLCADLGLMLEDRDDQAAYIGSWLQVLQRDTRAVFTAAAEAQKAVDYLKARAAPAA